MLLVRREIRSWVTHLLLFLSSQNSRAHTHTHAHIACTRTHSHFKSLIQQKWVICFQERISSCGAQMEGDAFAAALTPERELRFHCSISLKCPPSCIFNALNPGVKAWFLPFPVQYVRRLIAWLGEWDFTPVFCFPNLALQCSALQHWSAQIFLFIYFFNLW